MRRLLVRIKDAPGAPTLNGTLAIAYDPESGARREHCALANLLRLPAPRPEAGYTRYLRRVGVKTEVLRPTAFGDFEVRP